MISIWSGPIATVQPRKPHLATMAGLLAGLLTASSVFADRGLPVTGLGRDDGLPSTQTHAIAEGPSGAMWFAGPAGLSRYDGSSIRVFGPKDGLSTQGLRSLGVAEDGSIWIGHDRGLDRRDPSGRFAPVSDESWPHGFVDAIAVDPRGVWLGTSDGLVRWTEETGAVVVDEIPRGLISAVVVVGTDVWASGPTIGLWHLSDGTWAPLTNAAIDAIAPVLALTATSDDGMWLGGARGLARLDGASVSWVHNFSGDDERAVSALLPVDDELWIAAGGHLDSVTLSGLPLSAERVLSNIRINQMVMDGNANVWIATDGDGVAKISVLRRAISHARMPCQTQVYSIRAVSNGGFLIGGELCSWLLAHVDAAPQVLDRLSGVKVWDLMQSSSSTYWAATQLGLFQAAPGTDFGRALPLAPLDTIPGRALLERDGDMWVATVEGLFVVDDAGVAEIHDGFGESLGYVYTLVEDGGGRLWVGTIGRGAFRESENGELVGVSDPLISDSSNVYAVAHDGVGGAALVQDDAVLYSNGDAWRRLERATADNVAGWSLYFADATNLWLGSSSGLVLYRLPEGSVQRRLTAAMGLSGNEFTTSRSLAQDINGRMLLGLDSGLSLVNDVALAQVMRAPEPMLSAVRWNRAAVDTGGSVPVVAYGSWTVDLSLASSWFVDERGLMYRYRLAGFDQSFSTPLDRRQAVAHYTGLPWGEYRFLAQVYSPLFGWGEERELYRFMVDRPWWASGEMLLLWVIMAAAFMAGLVRWRTSTLRSQAQELEGIVGERTAALSEANQRLKRMVSEDDLTGVMNRRALWAEAERFRAIAHRENMTLGLIIFDLDHFKSINDRHGHPVGDAALVHVSEVVSDTLRTGEVLARWGGEEFAVLLAPAAQVPDLAVASERIRLALIDSPIVLADGPVIELTCSIGASSWQIEKQTFEDVLKQADEALYKAKETRNCSFVWGEREAVRQAPAD